MAAFLADSGVQQALNQIPAGFTRAENVQTMTIKTSCGWAGCFETELVSVRIVPVGEPINAHSYSIMAKVLTHNGNSAPRVELLAQDFFDQHSTGPTNSGCFR